MFRLLFGAVVCTAAVALLLKYNTKNANLIRIEPTRPRVA